MTTKKTAALDVLLVARSIHRKMAGDEEADVWVQMLLGIVRGLDSQISYNPRYSDIYFGLLANTDESKQTKLRRLIDHPNTPQPEREAALAALSRLRLSDD